MQCRQETTIKFEYIQLNKEKQTFSLHNFVIAIVAALYGTGLLAGICAMFGIDMEMLWPTATAVLVSLVLSCLWDLKKVKAIAAVIPAVVSLTMIKYTRNGLALMLNGIFDIIGAERRQIQLPFYVGCNQDQLGTCIAVTSCILMVWLILLGLHLIRDNNTITALVVIAFMIFVNLNFGNVISWCWMLVVATCTAMIMAKSFLCEAHIGDHQKAVINKEVLIIFCISAIAGLLMLAIVNPNEYKQPENLNKLSGKMESVVDEYRYGSGSMRAMPGGDFTDLGNLKFSDEVMLEVTVDAPESLYLRGFVGSDYSSEGWAIVDGNVLYNYADSFYWLHKNDIYGQSQIAAVAQLLEPKVSSKVVTMQIDTIGADSRYYYTPYEMTGLSNGEIQLLDPMILDDGLIPARGWTGQKTYQITSLENQVKRYPALVGQLKERSKEQVVQEYLAKESHYNKFVYETYTVMPDKTRQLIGNHLKKYGGKVGAGQTHLNYTQAKEIILEYLNTEITYSEKIQPKSESADFMTDFLEISKSGYSVHYATAATLMFRYYGIPARYVEGYLITPEMADDAKGAITITDKNAHAWVEYYQDGIGWIPFEVTPPYMDVMEQPETLTSSGSSGTSGHSSGAAMEMAQDNYEADEPEKENDDENVSWIKVLTAAGILLAAAMVIGVVVRLILRKRKLNALNRSFELDDIDASVINIFAYCVNLLNLLAIEKSQDIYEIYQEAAFSAEPVNEADKASVMEYKNQLLDQIRSQCGLMKRFNYRWIKGIY